MGRLIPHKLLIPAGVRFSNLTRSTIDVAKKYVVSSTLDRVDWNAELVCGDLEKAVKQLKQEPVRDCSREA